MGDELILGELAWADGGRAIGLSGVVDAADGVVQPRHSVGGPWSDVMGGVGSEAVFNESAATVPRCRVLGARPVPPGAVEGCLSTVVNVALEAREVTRLRVFGGAAGEDLPNGVQVGTERGSSGVRVFVADGRVAAAGRAEGRWLGWGREVLVLLWLGLWLWVVWRQLSRWRAPVGRLLPLLVLWGSLRGLLCPVARGPSVLRHLRCGLGGRPGPLLRHLL